MASASFRPGILRIHHDNNCHASSAVICGKIVLCPAHPILAHILDSPSDLYSILECLDQNPFAFNEDPTVPQLRVKCAIVPPSGDKAAEISVTPKFVFHSKAIRTTFLRLFSKNTSLKLSKKDEFTIDQRTLFLSAFLVFELNERIEPETFAESHAPPTAVNNRELSVIATPYGNVLMQGTTFKCRLANVVNDVLYLIDRPLSKGCEGGLVLSPFSDPLAMILTTTFESQNENLNLTFAGSLQEIVGGLREPTTRNIKKNADSLIFPTDPASKFVVLIESGRNSFGTGTLIRVGKKRLILTCSHVVADAEKNFCTWMGRRFSIRLIYKNPFFDRPFDVAVFEAPRDIPSSAFCRSANSNPVLGSTVKSIGFPVFDPVAVIDLNLQPSVYRGSLVNYRAGMVITDTVIQSGQSGGPLFNERDELMAIAVSNFRENDTGRVFPSLNCSVPLFNIIPYLSEYSDKDDVKYLEKLEGGPYLRKLWNFEEPVRSRM